MENTLLRITRIKVSRLYGLYDHDVELSLNDRITIIHGPNGVGKTALLRLIEALVQGKYFDLKRIQFQCFSLYLSDGSIVGIREKASDPHAPTSELDSDTTSPDEFFLQAADGSLQTTPLKKHQLDLDIVLRQIERETPWISRVGAEQWMDHNLGYILTPDEMINTYANKVPQKIQRRSFSEPKWLARIRSQISVHLIETQRLLRFETRSNRPWENNGKAVISTVQNYARELQEKITEALADYGKTSQSLDQSFPQRLLSGKISPLTSEELKHRMGELETQRADLTRIGLLGGDDVSYPFDVATLDRADLTQQTVMTLYVDDTAKKLAVLDSLAARVILLLTTVNKKFRNKTLSIDKKRGLFATDSNGKSLDLDALSSGEQHELVLMYDLLFRVRPNTLVLIDEPELSLHLSWQKSFLADLARIVSTAGFDVLLATHSPFIAGDRDDLMISLTSEIEK